VLSHAPNLQDERDTGGKPPRHQQGAGIFITIVVVSCFLVANSHHSHSNYVNLLQDMTGSDTRSDRLVCGEWASTFLFLILVEIYFYFYHLQYLS